MRRSCPARQCSAHGPDDPRVGIAKSAKLVAFGPSNPRRPASAAMRSK
jgi:hypothetical protein